MAKAPYKERIPGEKRKNSINEYIAICKLLDTGNAVSIETLAHVVNMHRLQEIDKEDIRSIHIRRLRSIVKEAKLMGMIDNSSNITISKGNVVAFKGILDLYNKRGRQNMIPVNVIEFIRGNLDYSLMNQIQNWIIDEADKIGVNKTKEVILPERFISIEDSLYVGNCEQEKRRLNEEKEKLLFLSKCILQRRAVNIKYRPHFLKDNSKPDTLIFHPEYLRRVGRKWMVYGMSFSFYFAQEKEGGYKYVNLILSRIESIEESSEPYKHSGVDYNDDPFKDQMTYHSFEPQNKVKEKVVLKVRKSKMPIEGSNISVYPFERIKQEPLHYSQKTIGEDADYGYISLQVTDAHFIAPLILTWGADIEVLEPLTLRQKVTIEVENMYKNYSHATNKSD